MRSSEKYRVCSREEVKRIIGFLEEKFGFPRRLFENCTFLFKGRSSIWIFTGHPSAPEIVPRVETVGMRALRKTAKGVLKPTTVFIQAFGRYASKNIVELRSEEEVLEFMSGGIVRGVFDVEEGFVIVKFRDDILGCGLYSRGTLKSRIPKVWRVKPKWFTSEG